MIGAVGLLSLLLAAPPQPSPRGGEGADPSLGGYSGLLDVPGAWVYAPGEATFLYTDEEDPRFRVLDPTTHEAWPFHTFTLAGGFLPYTEGHFRVTDVSPFGGTAMGIRDISFGGKLQLPLDLLWRDIPFAVAVGSTDEGGASPHFRSRYAVASGRWWRLDGTVGWGSGPDRLNGVFGGLQAKVFDWAGLIADYDARDWNAGVRLAVPVDVAGVPVSVGLIAKTTLTRDFGRPAWAGSVSVPLGGGKRYAAEGGGQQPPSVPSPAERGRAREGVSPEVREGVDHEAPAGRPSPALPTAVGRERPEGREGVSHVAREGVRPEAPLESHLTSLGFQSVHVGARGTTLVVHYENNVYNHAEADGLGVVLAAIRAAHLTGFDRYAITLHRNGLAQAELSGPMRAGRPDAAAMDFRWRPPQGQVDWVSPSPRSSSAGTLQLTLAPGLQDWIATEAGLFQYVVSLRPEGTVNLWPGASVNARWDIPVLWSGALDDGGPLRYQRGSPRLETALLQQVVPLAPGLSALLAAGAYLTDGRGALGELAWTPGQGALALGVRAAWMEEAGGGEHRSLTATARYDFAPLDLQARVEAGRFYFGDEGARVELSRFFGDTSVGMFYSHTDHQLLGIALSLPLTPRRDMRPDLIQVRGARRWTQEVFTRVGETRNVVAFGGAASPVSPWDLDGTWLDAGRLDGDTLRKTLPDDAWADEQAAE